MKPANIILDLLRTYRLRGTTAQDLTVTGQLFGFSENQIRVTLSRLVNRGTIEIVQRGHYRLCATADPVNDLAEGWRLGEARMKDWTGAHWLCVHYQSSPSGKGKEKAPWALTCFGFQKVAGGLWIRPDNLTRTTQSLKQHLITLGVPDSVIIMENSVLEDQITGAWISSINLAELEQQYTLMNQRLVTSLNRLPDLPIDLAKKESFEIGGRGIQILAKDPLLPESILPSHSRRQLWETMCQYDTAGRKIWAGKHQPETMPTSQLNFETLEAVQ